MRTLLHAPRSRRRSIAAATLGALALIGSLLVATPAHALNDTGTGGVFVPTTGRILDTKNNIGGYSTPMPAKTWRTVKVTGLAGVPDDGTVGAVSMVATVADITTAGQLFGRPDADTKYTLMGIYGGEQQQNTSFSSVLAVGADGTIQVYAETSARLILDVQGYYTANTDGTAPGGFVPLNGKRVADTRSGTGVPQAQLTTGKSAVLQVTGTAGVPAGASAVIVNLVAMNATSNVGFLTPYPTGAARPANSFNYAGGTTTTMQAQVKLSADGKITIYNANSTMDLAIDVQGYFTATGSSGAVFTPGSGRIFDSRATGSTILAGNETRAITVAGQAGVPVMGSGINSVVLTLTANAANGSGWGRVWANGTSEPDTASLRYDNGTVRSNTITVPIGANGKISLHNIGNGATNFLIDVQGWYANPQAPTISCPSPYLAGSWATAVPSADIMCTVVTPTESSSGQQLAVTLDGDLDSLNDLSESGTTTTSVAVPAHGGVHTISVEVDTASGAFITANIYSFGLGDWSLKSLTPAPADGAETNTAGSLSVAPADDTFGPDAQFHNVITSDADGSNLVADSDWVAGDFPIPATALAPGHTYFWSVSVRGTSGGSTTVKTVTSPTWSFVASTAPTAAISCPSPYQDGSWQHDALDAPVTCTVTAPPAYTDAAKLSVALDGNDVGSQPLSLGDPTQMTVTIPSGAAAHSIIATTSIDATNASTDATFAFGSGLWSNADYVPSIKDGGDSADIAPTLFVDTDGAPFSDDVELQYTVSANRDGSGVVAQSDWSSHPLSVESGTLTTGRTYFWHAEARGPLNDGSTIADVTTPTWSFTATTDSNLITGATTQDTTNSSQTESTQASAASSCPSWLFIGVRGTNEKAGSGKSRWGHGWTSGGYGEMEQVARKLRNDVRATVESLNYPASWSGSVGPVYWNSEAKGQANLISEVNAVAKSCSSTKIWIGGHSQGAQVVEDTLASKKFSKTAQANFRGGVLAGNPTYRWGEYVDAPGNGGLNGKLYPWHHSVDFLKAKNNKGKKVTQVRSYCFPNDLFCQTFGTSLPVHNSYKNEPTPSNEEKWLR